MLRYTQDASMHLDLRVEYLEDASRTCATTWRMGLEMRVKMGLRCIRLERHMTCVLRWI